MTQWQIALEITSHKENTFVVLSYESFGIICYSTITYFMLNNTHSKEKVWPSERVYT